MDIKEDTRELTKSFYACEMFFQLRVNSKLNKHLHETVHVFFFSEKFHEELIENPFMLHSRKYLERESK